MTQDETDGLDQYREAWLRAIRTALVSADSTPAGIKSLDENPFEADERETDICWLQLEVAGTASGHQALGIVRSAVRELGKLVAPDAKGGPGSESVVDDPLRVLADQAERLCSGAEVPDLSFTVTGTGTPDWDPSVAFGWQIESSAGPPIELVLYLDRALVESLGSPRQVTETTGEATKSSDITISMLRDVAIPATMVLGEAGLNVAEVLEFGAGEARSVDAPYGKIGELSVGGRIMARGQIVLVNGNYGLRITELAGEGARMAMLRDGDLVG